MRAFRFALRMLRRDLRTGELQLLGLSLVVAVAAVTAVGFFTDRVERAMELQAAELLAADLVVESTRPLPIDFTKEAVQRGLETADTLDFPRVVFQDLGSIKRIIVSSGNISAGGQINFRAYAIIP